MTGPREDVPLGSLEEFLGTCMPDRSGPPEPDPRVKKIFDDMRGDDAGQDTQPTPTKGDQKS